MGSAGDPSMLPLSVWKPLLNVCKSHTGYSHQYRYDFAIDFKNVLQASCDTFDDYLYASDLLSELSPRMCTKLPAVGFLEASIVIAPLSGES